MAKVKLDGTRVLTSYYANVDGVDYKVNHETWPGSKWTAAGERWRIFSAQGIHRYVRELDENKSTYRRVLVAVQQALLEHAWRKKAA